MNSSSQNHGALDVITMYTFFFYKHKVHKHTQPQIREILSTLLSTPPASDFEIDNKIFEKNAIFSPKLQNSNLNTKIRNTLQCFSL